LATLAIRSGWGVTDPKKDAYRFLKVLADELGRHASALTSGDLNNDIVNILGGASFETLVNADKKTLRDREIAAHTKKAQIEKAGVAGIETELLGSLGE
jgi:hypothetical protein